MSTLWKTGRALQAGLGLGLVAAFALVNGCGSADPAGKSGRSGDEPVGEDTAAITTGIYRCGSRAGDASLVVKRDGTCARYSTSLPGASGSYCPEGVCPSCRVLSRSIGCLLISPEGIPLDLEPGTRLYICTLAEGTVPGALVVRPDATCARYSTPLVGASPQFCIHGVCPSCWSLSRDINCTLTP